MDTATTDIQLGTNSSTNNRGHMHFLYYYVTCFAYLIVLYVTSSYIVRMGPYGIAILTLMIAIPVMIRGAYHAVVSRILFLQGLNREGKLFRFYSGYIVRLFWHAFIGLFAAIVMVVEVIYSTSSQIFVWSALGLSAILLYPVYLTVSVSVATETKPWNKDHISTLIATTVVALFIALGFSAVTHFGANAPVYDSIDAAISAQPEFTTDERSIALLFHFYNQARGATQYVLGSLRGEFAGRILYVFFYLTTVFLFFAGIASAMSTFCVPIRELRRVFARATTAAKPPLSALSVTLPIAVIIVVTVAYTVGFRGFAMEVERVNGQLVRSGTLELLAQAGRRYEDRLLNGLQIASTDTLSKMETSVDTMFSEMRANVDGFLDWYYGLGGETSRTAQRVRAFVTRDPDRVEQVVLQRLHEELIEGLETDTYLRHWNTFQSIANTLLRVTEEQYRFERDQIIAANSIDVAMNMGPMTVIREVDAFQFNVDEELRNRLDLQYEAFVQRQNASVVAGPLSVAISGAIVGRVIYKSGLAGVDRLLSKLPKNVRPLVRPILQSSRLAALSGPAAVVMVVVTLGVEYALLKLHEMNDRPQFKELILEAIDAAERDLKDQLRLLMEY